MPTVLVVDGIAKSRRMAVLALEGAGFDVIESAQAADAVHVAATSHPNVIVLDIDDRRAGGLATARRLKAESRARPIPILVLSRKTTRAWDDADAHLCKPYKPLELITAVRSLARLGDAEAALRTLTEEAEVRRRISEAAKEHYQLLFERNLAGVFRSGRDGRLIECNEVFTRLVGCRTPEEIAQRNVWEFFVDPIERDRLLDRLTSDRRVTNHEVRWRRRDGDEFTAMMNATRIGDGRDAHVEGIVLDISERKRAEDALRAREAQLRNLGDNLPDGVIYQVVRRPDGSNYFLYMSSGLEATFGASASEALRDAGVAYRMVLPEDLARIRAAADETIRTGEPMDVEYRMKTPNGEIRWMNLRGRPSRMADGSTLWDVIALDITERKRSAERYRQVFERSFVGMFRTRPDGIVLDCNDAFARILGYAGAADARGRSVLAHYARPGDRERVVTRISAGEDVVEAEMTARRVDGTLVPVAMSVRRVVDQDGPVHEGILVDLTRR